GLPCLPLNRSFLDLLWLWLNPSFLSLLGLEHHLITKFLQPLDEVFCALLFIQVLEVITTQFFVIDILFQNVPGRLQDRPRHRDDCPFFSSPRRQSPIQCGQIRVFLQGRGPPRFGQRSLEPLIAFRRSAAPVPTENSIYLVMLSLSP